MALSKNLRREFKYLSKEYLAQTMIAVRYTWSLTLRVQALRHEVYTPSHDYDASCRNPRGSRYSAIMELKPYMVRVLGPNSILVLCLDYLGYIPHIGVLGKPRPPQMRWSGRVL